MCRKWHPLIIRVGIFLTCTVAGCQGNHGVTGGTNGFFTIHDQPVGDVLVTVYQMVGGTPEKIGFAITNADGRFSLVTNAASGPLYLKPAEYRFTVETAGAPIDFPVEFSRPETTPLVIKWSDERDTLRLNVPHAKFIEYAK